jgi:hypothetical protein
LPRHTLAAAARLPAFVALTALSINCADGPLQPILPSWDVSITVPVMTRRYTAGEIFPVIPPAGIALKSFVVCDTSVIGDTTGDGTPDRVVDRGTLEDVTSGKLYVEVTNGLPVEITLKAGLLDASGQLLLPLPTGPADSIRVLSADTAAGGVSRPSVSTSVLDLTASDVRLLIPAERIRYAMVLEFPGGKTTGMNGADSLLVRMWTTVSYRVNQ